MKPQEGRLATRLTRSYLNLIGRGILHVIRTIHGLGAFALITLGVTFDEIWALTESHFSPRSLANLSRRLAAVADDFFFGGRPGPGDHWAGGPRF